MKPLEKRDFSNHNKLNIVLISGVNGVGKQQQLENWKNLKRKWQQSSFISQ